MEKFSKVLSRQQAMMNHSLWRIEVAEYFTLRFGYRRAIVLMGEQKIGFDVQADPVQAQWIVEQYRNTGQMPVPVLISLS
jgi:hypothetical protein